MEQLIMRWKNDGTPREPLSLPEGVTVKTFPEIPEAERVWLDIVSYMYEEEDVDVYEEGFYRRVMTEHLHYDEKHCYFLLVDGVCAATIAVICDYAKQEGYVHMVSCKPEFRGRGLGSLMNRLVIDVFKAEGMRTAWLTTDDWRIPAIKSYLRIGFEPDRESEPDFEARWQKIFESIGK